MKPMIYKKEYVVEVLHEEVIGWLLGGDYSED
jgi:hypothetical protein